jgi:hypothetical protein
MMPTKPVRAVVDSFGDDVQTGVQAIENAPWH